MPDAAIVTGASSGIGEAIAEELLDEGYEVFGFGRDFSKSRIHHPMFHKVICDLLNTDDLFNHLQEIPLNEVRVLVNNAGVAYYGLHEEMSTEKIQTMVRTNLEVPMILSQKLIRQLRKNKGTIINISSVTALQESTHAAAYGATKAALLHFSNTLFQENRKYGMKVCTILPDLTDTNLYRNADFSISSAENERLISEDIAAVVRFIMTARAGMVAETITVRPQINRIVRKQKG